MTPKRGILFVLLVLGLMLASLACSASQAAPISSPTASQTPSGLNGLTYFPVQKLGYEALAYPCALAQGELVLDDGYLRLKPSIGLDGTSRGSLIIWPPGSTWQMENDRIQILNQEGKPIARSGETLRIGGGEVPEEIVSKYTGQTLPDGCQGPYWLASPGVYNAPPSASPPSPRTNWEPGSPPPAGIGGWQQPRPLTEDEKARVIEIAVSSPEASTWLQGRTDYRTSSVNWYAIIWSPDGEAGQWWASEYKIVDERIPNYISPYAYWYPGVTIAVGEGTIYQMQIAVDLEAGKPVMVDGPYPSLSSPDRFRQLPTPSISGGQSHSDTRQSSELPLRIVSLTSPVSPGLNATLVVETLPGAECSAIVDYGPSGNGVLHPRMADGTGRVSWTWTVGRFSGTWHISITAKYGGKSKMIMAPFTVH
ncbi:MAG: hypothetical protein PHU23_06120 [Dehalococcoidales bacterium]|nr:hypothetical protein [Dehalococcoidales bacterium]